MKLTPEQEAWFDLTMAPVLQGIRKADLAKAKEALHPRGTTDNLDDEYDPETFTAGVAYMLDIITEVHGTHGMIMVLCELEHQALVDLQALIDEGENTPWGYELKQRMDSGNV